MSNTYDIFISYRREGGDFLGQLLYERLSHMGYSVFFDVESLRSGKFNEALYKYMDGCTDAIVLLPPNALDRCVNEDDWVRKEISYLIKKQKNIIPVMMRGFVFPSELPKDMRDFDKYNGIVAQEASSFSWVIDQLINKFLKSAPQENNFTKTTSLPNFDQEMERLLGNKNYGESEDDTISSLNKKLSDIKTKNYHKQINSCLTICNNEWNSIKDKFISTKEKYFAFPNVSGFKTAVFQIDLHDDYSTLGRYFDFTQLDPLDINPEQLSGTVFKYERSNYKNMFVVVMTCKENGEFLFICPKLENEHLVIPQDELAVLKYKDVVVENDGRNSLKYNVNQSNAELTRFEANLGTEVSLVLDAETLKPIPREIASENGQIKAYITIEPFKSYIVLQLNFSGHGETMMKLSSLDIAQNYQYGKNGFPIDILKAIEYYQKDNSGESLYQISQIFKNDDIYNDDEEYKLYLQSAVEKNYSKAIAETIFNTYKNNGCKINAEIANQITDDAEVQRSLNIYSNYLIKNNKYDDAFKCLEMAATTGNSTAVSNLGYMYKNGYGCSVDYAKAKELFEESMAMGSYGPYGHLAEMYEHGLGVKKDRKKASEYYKMGAKLGNERCIEWIKNNSND